MNLVLLGVIAAATVVIAFVQVRLLIAADRLGRRVEQLRVQVDQDVRPLLAHAREIADSAARATALATVQVERADRLFGDLARRVDETAAAIQASVLAPAREGRALLAGVGAAMSAFRELRAAARARSAADEEESLFIG